METSRLGALVLSPRRIFASLGLEVLTMLSVITDRTEGDTQDI
jgi:hypothetical protein